MHLHCATVLTIGVEGFAHAIGGEHAQTKEVKRDGGVQRERAATDKRRLALTRTQCQYGLVQGCHG